MSHYSLHSIQKRLKMAFKTPTSDKELILIRSNRTKRTLNVLYYFMSEKCLNFPCCHNNTILLTALIK